MAIRNPEGWTKFFGITQEQFDKLLPEVRSTRQGEGVKMSPFNVRKLKRLCGQMRRKENSRRQAAAPAPVAGSLSASGNGSAVSIAAKND